MNKGPLQLLLLCGIFCITLLLPTGAFGQRTFPKIRFVESENALFGFDDYEVVQWRNNYESMRTEDSIPFRVPYKSMLRGSTDHVNIFLDPTVDSLPNLSFQLNDSLIELNYSHVSRDTIQLELPAFEEDYLLKVYLNNRFESALRVLNYDELTFKVQVVPLTNRSINRDSLLHYLNRVYGQAGVSIDLTIEPLFTPDSEIDSILSNPSGDHDRYTDQMIEIRNDFFERRKKEPGAYYLFIVPGFVSQSIDGYMVRNKGVGFIKHGGPRFYRAIARQLGYGMGQLDDLWKDNGPPKGTTKNLMDASGLKLTYEQWEQIRQSGQMVSYFDDYENIYTRSGLIAYYLWEELEDGTIRFKSGSPLKGIVRPYKKNTYSLYLNIDNFLFWQLFDVWTYPICLLHILGFALLAFSSVWVRRKTLKKVEFLRKRRLFRWATRFASFIVHLWLFWMLFLLINEGYFLFEVQEGKLNQLEGLSAKQARKEVEGNENIRRNEEKEMGSEVLVKRNNNWYLERKKKVLYFEVREKDGKQTLRYRSDRDELYLPTLKYRANVTSHYFVFRYVNDSSEVIEKERVFNHQGTDITDKLNIDDPAERILIFVNGYRPTSLGQSFEENFEDIQKNGLEFRNSLNLIYDDDYKKYWYWNSFSDLFKKRINPSKTYFADGHHSVTTSNHKTLIDFTQLSASYPKRCKDPNHHTCKKSEVGWTWIGLGREVPTYETLHLEPNVEGFDLRYSNGRIAGRNMYQILNEIPAKSSNDTLYIVAHSMGYAYALGMIEKLRGKVNFGGLYIIAPENAESGRVNESEWKEVWQYGSDFEAHKMSAPCLLDGIAPQTKAEGLSPRNRVYIPEKLYNRMGFFDSHFIGHYTWIFDIPQGSPGYVRQR